MKPNSKFLLFFIFFPPVSLLFLMYKYAVNIAHWDDHAIRYSVINIVKSNSFLEKIQLLFKQHNEHRIVITRITAYISNLFVGSIDYRFLMLVGFAFLISILLIIKRLNFNNLILSIFSLLIFHPAFYENTFWGMASVQNFGVLFFAFLTAYFVAKENIKMAIFAATLCVFTSGNGILILISVCCFYILFKEYQKAKIWIFSSILILICYYFDYHKIETSVNSDLSDVFLLQKGFISMAGSFFDTFVFYFPKRLIIIYLAGFLNLVFAGFFVIKFVSNKSKTSKEVFIFILYLFILGSIAATTISRIGYGVETLIGSKYKIYSFILLFLNFYSILIRNNKLAFPILIFSVIINLTSYIFENQNLIFQKNERIAEYLNANSVISDFEKLDVFRKTDNFNKIIKRERTYKSFEFEKLEFEDNYEIKFDTNLENDYGYFELTDGLKTHYFPLDSRKRSLRQFFSTSKLSLVKVTIPKNSISTSVFKTSYIDGLYFKYTGKTIELKGITQQKIKQNW